MENNNNGDANGEEKKVNIKVTVEVPFDKIGAFMKVMEGFCASANWSSPTFERELNTNQGYYENSLWDILIKKKIYTEEELKSLDVDDGVLLIEKVINSGRVTENDLASYLSAEYGMENGMETVDISNHHVAKDIKDSVSTDLIKRYHFIPIYKNGSVLTVAISDPTNMEVLDSLRYILKTDIEGVVVPYFQLEKAVKEWV